jgi:hypothetical protein
MPADEDVDELIGLVADDRLLAVDPALLPASVGRPHPLPESATRGRLVGAGVTLTTVTLLGGTVLALCGAIDVLFENGGVLGVIALVLGLLLAGTHWGWVHVAEAYADSLEGRRNAGVIGERQEWLRTIAPYTRYEVGTSAGDDGSIAIERVRHRPVLAGERAFTFTRDVELREVHSGDEPAAVVTERAEILRRQAALDTERERKHFEALAGVFEHRRLRDGDDAERREAAAAASRALSDQINANLRDPPLVE